MADTGVEEDSGARFAVERSSGVFYNSVLAAPLSFIHFILSVHDAS